MHFSIRRPSLAVCAALATAFLSVPGPAAADDLDPRFGTGGKVTTDFGPGSDGAYAVAVQADGKIVTAGTSGLGDFALARYNPDGSLDPSFGAGGMVTTDIGAGGFDAAYSVALQADGKIVAAGTTAPRGYCCQFGLARYNPDGSLDASFDGDGKVTTNFGGNSPAFAVAVQPDGKIVAVGSTYNPYPLIDDFALARYNGDGSLDPTFGTGGMVTTDFGGIDRGEGVAIQTDGKIVAAGSGGLSDDFALARYNGDGSLDPTFGTGGKVTTDFGSSDRAYDVAIQKDGKIVAVGFSAPNVVDFAVARYNPDGTLDASFGTDGKVTTDFSGGSDDRAAAVAIQPDGRIVAAGFSSFNFRTEFALTRYNPDGVLDAGFGTGGKVLTDFGEGGARAEAVAIQADRKIVAAGSACVPECGFALARYRLRRAVDGP
jgi:uncharacterized delta-60 repeat protein